MKKRYLLPLSIAILFSPQLFAKELKVGLGQLKFDYTETSPSGTYLNSEKSEYSDIDGLEIVYNQTLSPINRDKQSTTLEISLRHFDGPTNYDGFLQSTVTGQILAPYKTITQNKLTNTKIRFYQTTHQPTYDASIFASFGYREWERDITGPFGLLENYNWKYYDVGLKFTWYEKRWSIGFEAAYQEAIAPEMTAYINGSIKFDLGDTTGHYYKIPIRYALNESWDIEAAYEYNEWKISKSTVVNGFYEPDSVTKNSFATLGVVYHF